MARQLLRVALASGLLCGGASVPADAAALSDAAALDDECGADAPGAGRGDCAVNALQLRARGGARAEAEADAQGACHDVKDDEPGPCLNAINWAKNVGYPQHPEWYPGLSPATSSNGDWQYFSWNTSHPTCPRPCGRVWDDQWCRTPDVPKLWQPAPVTTPVRIKILSYNLFWWNLFNIRGGFSAGALIKSSGEPELYDVMGLQECEDPARVLGPHGLAGVYTAFNTSKATCMAYRTDAWTLIDHGEREVAMDMKTEYYGRRSAQWMRLQHKKTGLFLFFVNHHGPLSVNSGGACGGQNTAHNLLQTMHENGKPGDVVVLVGDFNANAASKTVQALWPHLTQIYNSVSFGGVDNMFSNVPRAGVAETLDLGSGGSDHHAISAVLALPAGSSVNAAAASAEPVLAVDTLRHAGGADGCMIEPGEMYTYAPGGWTSFAHNIVDPRACCNACQGHAECKAWTWEEWNTGIKGPLCTMRGVPPSGTAPSAGTVASGLPKGAAVYETLTASRAL